MAKIVEQTLKSTFAKSFFHYIKNTDLEDTFYAGVANIDDSEYSIYTGYSLDSDSEIEFYGGKQVLDFDLDDKTFYAQNTFSLHKIFTGGVSRVVPRIQWVENTIYPAWPDSDSYVLVKEYVTGFARLNVYRCLFSPGKASSYIPSGVSSSEIYLPDGYVWKYLYTISNSEAQRFLTEDFMPVPERVTQKEGVDLPTTTNRYRQFVVQQNATPGELYGFNWDSDILVNQTDIVSDGSLSVTASMATGADAEQNFSVLLNYDSVTKNITAELVNKGKGYFGQVKFLDASTDSEIPGIDGAVLQGRGHGSDVAAEMFSNKIMLISRVVPNTENAKVINNNNFNMITLIRNPIDGTTNNIATRDFYVACKSIKTDTVSTFVTGDIIKPSPLDDGRRAKIVSVQSDTIYYINYKIGGEKDIFKAGETITNISGTKTATISESFDRENIFDTGDLLIADKKHISFIRSPDQVESLIFLLDF